MSDPTTPFAVWLRRAAQAVRRAGERAINNPIVRKELRGRMRGWRAVVVLTVHLTLLSCFAAMIYFGVAQSMSAVGVGPAGREMGQVLFFSTYSLLLLLVVFISPAFTAGAISGERERRTLDLLITTLLPTRALVLGKLASALAYVLLLILAALPILSLALVFGGVTLGEVLIGTLILIATALASGAVGLLISSLLRSTLASTVLTYAAIMLTTLGLPMVLLFSTSFFGFVFINGMDTLAWVVQVALVYLGGLLICTNPFATAVAAKMVLDEYNSFLFFSLPVYDSSGVSRNLPMVSPWVVYLIFCVLFSAALVAASVLVIHRRRG